MRSKLWSLVQKLTLVLPPRSTKKNMEGKGTVSACAFVALDVVGAVGAAPEYGTIVCID